MAYVTLNSFSNSVPNANGQVKIRLKATANRPAGAVASASFTVAAPNTVYGVAVAGQSNASGLAPQAALSSAQKGPWNKTLIWNDDTNAYESLLIADATNAAGNEQGLNGGASGMPPRTDGATIPSGLESYVDGFGFEQRFAELLQASATSAKYYFKLNVERPASTNGSSIAAWQSDLFTLYETEYNRAKAKLATENKTLVTEYLLWNQGEADQNNANYVADLNALITRFKTLFNNPNLKIIVVRTKGASNQYSAVGSRQMDYVLQEPAAQFIDIPNHGYLSDNVHTNAASMIAGGEIWYHMTYGTKDTTVPTVVSRTVLNATTIRVVYSEPILGDLTGVSFQRNGSALTPTVRTGNGSNTADFTVPTIAPGDVITHTYNDVTGKVIDFSRNKLASFTNQPVTNNLASNDTTPPTLVASTTRAENEYSNANQIVLTYNEALKADSLPTAADVTTVPSNTLSSAVVSGNDMILTFANPFPRSNTAIQITTINNKIKDAGNNAASNLTNQTINNWIGATLSGYTVAPFPNTPGVTNTNNFWRSSSTNNNWGNGGLVGLKLASGTNGSMAIHYAKPGLLGGIGFKGINYFGGGLKLQGTTNTEWFDGFFIDSNSNITWAKGITTTSTQSSGIIKAGTLGNWYRIVRNSGTLTIEESSDGTSWTTLYTFTYPASNDISGDIYGMYDLFGFTDNKLPYPQYQGLTTTPFNTVAEHITFSTANKFAAIYEQTYGPSGTGLTDGYGYTGLASKKLPASTSGRVFGVFQGGATGQGNSSSLGFKTANTLGGNASLLAAVNVGNDGKVYTIRNGTYNGTVLYTLTGPTFLGIYRDGATGSIKLQRSSDSVTWVDLLTFPNTSTADLFIGADTYYNATSPTASGRIVTPKGEGLITV